MKLTLLGIILTLTATLASANDFVPADCTVESWCLSRATACFFGHFSQPNGLWRGHAQYSVVRKVVALCPSYYGGQLERRNITGPVEPIRFESTIEVSKEKAQQGALDLCTIYRTDWVGAAPACESSRSNLY